MKEIKKCKKCGGDVREVIINSFPQQRKMKCIECGLEHLQEEKVSKEIEIKYKDIYKDLIDLKKSAIKVDKTSEGGIDVITVYKNIEIKIEEVEKNTKTRVTDELTKPKQSMIY